MEIRSIGRLLKEIRTQKGLSQYQVGKRMGDKSNGYVFGTESGKYMPDDDRLRKYAKALEITWEEMLKLKRKSELIEMGIQEENIFTDMLRIPLLGTVPCGNPQEAIEETGEFVPIPFDPILSNRQNLFALKANGLSMIEADIRHGDIIIIDPNSEVKNGDIVVAMIDNEATLKYYYERGGYVELKPANPNFKPIKTNDPSFKIVGKLILKATYQSY